MTYGVANRRMVRDELDGSGPRRVGRDDDRARVGATELDQRVQGRPDRGDVHAAPGHERGQVDAFGGGVDHQEVRAERLGHGGGCSRTGSR